MTMPVRSLTVLQNWDCGGCTMCCRSYHVTVTDEERDRIEAQGWEREPDFKDTRLFVLEGNAARGFARRLNHRPAGACVFLGADNRCRIHAKFGSAAKPFACRVYPFVLVPVGDHWRVGLRYACPAAPADSGRPLAEHVPELREYADTLEAELGSRAVGAAPTPLQAKQSVPWEDLIRFANAISLTLADEEDTLERRWRRVLGLADLCRKSRFDGGGDAKKAVTGGRLNEFLYLLREALDDETPIAEEMPRPGWVGRSVFRPLLALYCRKDTGPEKGTAQAGPVGRLRAAIRFARGRGRVPNVHADLPAATFADAETPGEGFSIDAEHLLTRYYRVKVESLQFCGPSNFQLGFWDGLESLAFTLPAIGWLSRILAVGGRPHEEAVTRALRIVDDNFGFNPLLGQSRQKFALRLLANRGELPKLLAWYGR